MGHFTYPAGTPLGTVPFGYVVPSAEWQSTIRQIFKAINGDEGGTWAPSSFIVVGGSGFSLTGTGHQIAASARLTVQSTGEIRVANGGLMRLDGSGGDILMKVASNIATIEVESGAVVQVNAGGALDVYGSATFKSGGTGQWESGSNATFLSGSTFTLASGATANLTGSTLVRGTLTIKASGGPGSLVIEAGTTNPFAGLIQLLSTSELRFTAGSALTGTIEVSGDTSSITLKDGMTLTAEAGADGDWDGTWVFRGTSMTLAEGLDVTLSPARSWTRRGYRVAATTYNASLAAAIGDAFSSVYTSTPTILLNGSISSITQKAIIEIETPPDGATAVSVSVKCQGLTSEAITATPTYRLIRWQGSLTGATSNMSAIATDVHDGTAPNWVTTETTTFVVTANATIDRTYRYGVLVTFPVNSTGDTSMAELDIELTGTTTTITGR